VSRGGAESAEEETRNSRVALQSLRETVGLEEQRIGAKSLSAKRLVLLRHFSCPSVLRRACPSAPLGLGLRSGLALVLGHARFAEASGLPPLRTPRSCVKFLSTS